MDHSLGREIARPTGADEAHQDFARLYRELFPPVYGYVRYRVGDQQVAEDLTAHIFERALTRLATLRRAERARAWLFTLARTAIADHWRRQRPTAPLAAVEALPHLWVAAPDQAAERRDDARRLLAALGELSERERDLLGLKFAAGLTNREIAPILGLSETNVAQIAHRAIVKLRDQLQEERRQ